MEINCQFCGELVKLKPPYRTNYQYKERPLKKIRKAKKDDLKNNMLIITEMRKHGTWVKYVTGEWMAKSGLGSWSGICECGKRVFDIEDIEINYTVKCPRSNIDGRQVVNVATTSLKLFEIGLHWYKPNFKNLKTDNIQDIRKSNQLGLWNN